ncbi:hypothetical protein [Brucella anthropi]|uniref:hypothetical protein n=1 Tax=Brucella anthropi TaxID=529 RepID=UPI00244A058B|nr:hypothetical protein [Brucella anthropi]MDH0368005.1 hypothetical protein [Brucella anthropi]
MIETMFTPGPWKTSNGTDIFPVADTEGWFYIADCDPSNVPLSREDDGMIYAQAKANARLIAAAPDLYEALFRLSVDCKLAGLEEQAGFDCWLKMADEVLAKARGEAV